MAGGKGGTVVWNQTVKALCYPSMCLMGSVAERSKALVLGTSLFGGVGSNPTAARIFFEN